MAKVCQSCFVTSMVADLRYAHGKRPGREANVDTGAWLHHMVWAAQGPTRQRLSQPDRPPARAERGQSLTP